LRLFKKSRNNALKKKSLIDYLKYSIGEIVIVVIGILIAVFINNWSSENKTDKDIQGYYNRIQ